MKTPFTHIPRTLDQTILYLISRGNERGYALLYDYYWDNLVAYTGSLVGDTDTAGEIVQQIFVHIYAKEAFSIRRGCLWPYLRKAAQNRAINYFRDKGARDRHTLAHSQDRPTEADEVSQELYLSDLYREVRRCLAALPVRYTEVFILNRLHALSVKEVSQQLGRPEGTVEKQLRKALDHLKTHLDIRLFRTA
ncbi:RNA polymerase sigma factor [Chitinophaga lutea]